VQHGVLSAAQATAIADATLKGLARALAVAVGTGSGPIPRQQQSTLRSMLRSWGRTDPAPHKWTAARQAEVTRALAGLKLVLREAAAS
jgi:hypothetical protein